MTGYRCARLDGTAYLTPTGKETTDAKEAQVFTSAFVAATFILDTGHNPVLWDWQPCTVAEVAR